MDEEQIDAYSDVGEAAAKREERRGLDEVRRLLIMADVLHIRKEQCGAELVASITNAIRYHHPGLLGQAERRDLFRCMVAGGDTVIDSPVRDAIQAINRALGQDGD